MGESTSSPLSQAMNRLWAKYLPQMQKRVAILQSAAISVAHGTLSEAEQQHACEDAHKLAGVLGTFGLQDGTELAREAEAVYGRSLDGSPEMTERLIHIAQQLSTLIASRR